MVLPKQVDRHVTLVGAGLVGSLLALFLARRGFRVTLLERRSDLRKERQSAGRSINLAISTRGLHALRAVGLEAETLPHLIPMKGRMIHPVTGELGFQPYGKDESQYINAISRAWLNKVLLTHAEQTGRVSIEFRQRVTAVDLKAGTLTVHDEATGTTSVREAPVVLGTDGSASAVRQALTESVGLQSQTETLAHGYKELEIPAGQDALHAIERNALHIWPRGNYMMIALPNEDGSFTCTLFLPFEGPTSFATLGTPADVRAFFERDFPDARALMPSLEEDFFRNPTARMVGVKSAPWHFEGRALLLGDAAHAMVPFYGQGMNCGFEDCFALDQTLSEEPDFARAFARFNSERKPNADAISDMAVENFVEMRDKTADPQFLLEKAVEKKLLNAFPDEFLSRYSLVSFSLLPYRFAYRVGEVAQEIVAELAQDLVRVEDLDLERAGTLVRTRLGPLLKERPEGARS